jgi:phosphatidylglycerophosphate synthase
MYMHIWVDARSAYAFEKIYSVTLLERILRQLFELGVRNHVSVTVAPDTSLDRFMRSDFWSRFPLEFELVDSEVPLSRIVNSERYANRSVIILEGDGIYDERVLRKLLSSTHSLYINDGNNNEAPVAVFIRSDDRQYLNMDATHIRDWLQQGVREGWLGTLSVYSMDRYIPDLRQTAVPILMRFQQGACIRTIENEMYEKTFKGVMDFIATYIYRLPVRGLVRLLAPTCVTPNHITAISVICSFAAIPLFVMGWMWAGLVVAFTFIIADSLDGKLARLTVRLSNVAGHVDHVTSPLFEACYYVAWGWHFSGGDFTAWPGRAGLILFGFFGLDRITTSVFGLKYGHSLLDYKEWDARFHLIAGRRNINLFVMTLGCLFQKPVIALYIITVWMGVTMCWHMARFALHASQSAAGLHG